MGNTVLIITDDVATADILASTLATARDGPFYTEWVRLLSDGISRLEQSAVDIILLDLLLPDSQNITTFDVLFKAVPFIPIITLCYEKDEAISVEAVQRGAQGFMTKGYLKNALVPQSLRNVIHRKSVEESLFIEKERARVTLESIDDGVLSTDNKGNVTYLNGQAESMTGWTREEACGHPIAEVFQLIDSVTRQIARNPVELVIEHKKPMSLDANSVLVRRDGYEIAIEDSVAPIFNQGGAVTGAVVTFRDASQARAVAQKMERLAYHDYLTDLPNRMLLNDRLSQAISYAVRHDTHLAILFLDLDKFKSINDSFGHLIGDKLLASVAQRLVAQVRHSDTVSRQGGDEFVILLLEEGDAENAAVTAEKILHALGETHHIEGHNLHITTSIGISIFPSDANDADALVKNADSAMYRAKKKGRNNYEFFSSKLNN